MLGRAKMLKGKEEKKYYALYKKRYSWANDFKTSHKLYIIKPIEAWYIDEIFFGHFYRMRAV
jgi:hypothetical protein